MADEVTERLAALTERERDVLRRVSQGKSNAAIAAELVVSVETVRSHVRHILLKLEFKSRHQAADLWRSTVAEDHPVGDSVRGSSSLI